MSYDMLTNSQKKIVKWLAEEAWAENITRLFSVKHWREDGLGAITPDWASDTVKKSLPQVTRLELDNLKDLGLIQETQGKYALTEKGFMAAHTNFETDVQPSKVDPGADEKRFIQRLVRLARDERYGYELDLAIASAKLKRYRVVSVLNEQMRTSIPGTEEIIRTLMAKKFLIRAQKGGYRLTSAAVEAVDSDLAQARQARHDTGLGPVNETVLAEILRQHFSQEELKDLTHTVDLDYKDFPPGSKRDKCCQLVADMKRRGRLLHLIIAAVRQRSDIDWFAILEG
jgi:hypothetical protein